jgi:geranylgeranyl reductase
METFDAVIVGAGPGGLRCATTLARHGRKVLVLERKPSIGHKVCAGGIPYHALAELAIPPQILEASFPTQVIHTPWQQARVCYPEPVITTVNRARLGAWQEAEARQAGAEIRTGDAVTAITATTVETANHCFAYRTLIGADGSASMVRRHLNIGSRKLGTGINYQLPGRWPEMEWHLDPKRFSSGYAWIFPHGRTTSIGAYADRADLSAATLHQRLLAWAKERDIELVHGGGQASDDGRARAALINFDYRGWNFAPLFLVGDAAGLASGFTGEGIYPAIISGETVARTILDRNYQPSRLHHLLARQRLHNRLQKFYTGNKVLCQISLEMLVLAIRTKIIGFAALEMY